MLKLRDIEELNEKVVNVPEPSLADELELATENLEKEDLKKGFNALKTKLKKLEVNKDEKKTLLKHLLELSNQRTEELSYLKESLEKLSKDRKSRCRFG